ncbi:UTP-hexose-1-phosphate uridylyltransferase [Breznakia blatticola]|uniref:Galactose-1-phosphate uridylyltransferase n=1 Tax=Breznakia blatticola TaxID=1754012 RepID=A0A4R8A8T7_9FIRM|nr:UDP-glucose--hexose-1-phosphate uridylyltransferase [Breznakia blatticola]TDW26088.1 UTP-hexose-1-phosphate uridylyltransferase [Breznakia blatticola]
MDYLVSELLNYGIHTNLIGDEEVVYSANLILDVLGLDTFALQEVHENRELVEILDDIQAQQLEAGKLEDLQATKEIFRAKLMNTMVPRPHTVIEKFYVDYEQHPKHASDQYYNFSIHTNYIQKDRMGLNRKWKTATPYGKIDITINLAKPEKDPKDIAAAKNVKSTGYPKCLLCKENEGYAGTLSHPARSNHRIIPLRLNEQTYFMQYSPYVYYNEHCIIFNKEHKPMAIDQNAFQALCDFVDFLPHYFIGSNADLPIVGGSILSHDHFQGGNYTFAMAKANTLDEYGSTRYADLHYGRLNWPMSVIRATSKNKEDMVSFACDVLEHWKKYSDEKVHVLANTNGERHNTITPIVRKVNDIYEMDLVLRNNRTSDTYPDGIFHPHRQYHNIKKENIGLIEVMGLAVLPARLVHELDVIKESFLQGKAQLPTEIRVHQNWYENLLEKHANIDANKVDTMLQDEVGQVFLHVLENAGVFKQDVEGQQAFTRFLKTID